MTKWHDLAKIGLGTPATYRIVVRGQLDQSWSDRFGGLEIHAIGEMWDPPWTILVGRLIDQAALFGVLDRLYGLGFALLSVECLSEEDS